MGNQGAADSYCSARSIAALETAAQGAATECHIVGHGPRGGINAQRAGGTDRDRAIAADRAVFEDRECAAVYSRGAGVGAVPTQHERAGAVFGEAEISAGDRATDREDAIGYSNGAGCVHGHPAGAEIEVACAVEGEVTVPVLSVVVGKGLGGTAGVVNRAAGDREGAGADGGGAVDIECSCTEGGGARVGA